MTTSSVKEEEELGDVVMIMSQQLPNTDMFIKFGCLSLFLKPRRLPLPLTQSYVSFYHLCVVQKHLTGSNAHFRQE